MNKLVESEEYYRSLLANADWYYEMSDDYNVWKRGNDTFKILYPQQRYLDPDGSIWNEYRPKGALSFVPYPMLA